MQHNVLITSSNQPQMRFESEDYNIALKKFEYSCAFSYYGVELGFFLDPVVKLNSPLGHRESKILKRTEG